MLGAWLMLTGCTGEPPLPTPVLPTETGDTDVFPVDTGYYRPPDTAQVTLGDEVPDHVILLEQTGTWSLSPAGGPFDTLIGTLNARELLDGALPSTADTARQLECDATWALQGTPAPAGNGCPSCGHVWDVQFTLSATTATDPSACHDPDLPADGDTWRLGYGGQTVWFDFYGTGAWVPWWSASQNGNIVTIDWTRELAIDVPEEDP